VDIFSETSVQRDPEDIELVHEVTLRQLSDWLLRLMDGLPEHYLELVRDLDALKSGLSPIFKEIQEGDTIWLGKSRLRGPLWGHEGIALVRDNRPIVYIRAVDY
jgi:hypothetical protein